MRALCIDHGSTASATVEVEVGPREAEDARRVSDIVGTVPAGLWEDWIAEGDLPGARWSGTYWSFYCGGGVPARISTSGRRLAGTFLPTGEVWGGSPGDDMAWSGERDGGWHLVNDGSRFYVVAHGRLRGYAPLYAIETDREDEPGGKLRAFVRRGGAVAVTIPEEIRGFRGWRYRWWDRADERPFPAWRDPQPGGAP